METEIRPVDLRNRWLAAFFAWLFPGLGHFYQGRTVKGMIYFLSLAPLIVIGLWMGSYRDMSGNREHPRSGEGTVALTNDDAPLYVAKNAYFQWEKGGDKRLYFIPQALNAVIAIPAYIQAKLIRDGKEPLWNGAFAPPGPDSPYPSRSADRTGTIYRPSLNELLLRLHSWFDLGTIILAVAGLLNLLVIFDALCGPAWILPETSEKTPQETE